MIDHSEDSLAFRLTGNPPLQPHNSLPDHRINYRISFHSCHSLKDSSSRIRGIGLIEVYARDGGTQWLKRVWNPDGETTILSSTLFDSSQYLSFECLCTAHSLSLGSFSHF
jgi:hypothetical protein